MASIASRYQVVLKDQDGTRVALFDSFASLNITKEVNGIGSFSLSFYDNNDIRFGLFELDGQIEVYRSLPYAGLDWYLEFEGLIRDFKRTTDEGGHQYIEFIGYGYNHLLTRRNIAYKSGTTFAEKNADCETVMKAYVSENCGPLAGDATRIRSGIMPGFAVQAVSGDAGDTPTWTGDRAFEDLLDVLQEISDFSHHSEPTDRGLDFAVVGTGAAAFEFRTYIDQLGTDRTVGSANPVVFSLELGNLRDFEHDRDYTGEITIAIVLGKGERSTRKVIYRENTNESALSPWNDIETSHSSSLNEFEYQLEDAGDAVLRESIYRESFSGTPMQTPSSLYGLHYFLGDKVTVENEGIERDKKIVSVTINVEGDRENLEFVFSDLA